MGIEQMGKSRDTIDAELLQVGWKEMYLDDAHAMTHMVSEDIKYKLDEVKKEQKICEIKAKGIKLPLPKL